MNDTADTADILQLLRSNDPDIEKVGQFIENLEDEEQDIEAPDTSEVYNEKIEVNAQRLIQNDRDGIKVNGEYVHLLYVRIINQLAAGQSPIIIICGKERKGKSMAALVLAYYLHDKLNVCRGSFNPEQQTVYNVVEFLTAVMEHTRSVIMFEEANETVNKNQYHSDMNQAVARTLRTQGKRQNVYIFIGPEYKELDSRVRDKVDVLVEMERKQVAKVTCYQLRHGKRGSKGSDYVYQPYPTWHVPDVPTDLKQEYERIDNRFKGNYIRDILLDLLRNKMQELKDEKTVTLWYF